MITKKKLLKRIEYLKTELEKKTNEDDLVSCDVCGCLLKKEEAIRGKSKIVEKSIFRLFFGMARRVSDRTQEIQEVYYCKIHGKNKKRKPINK